MLKVYFHANIHEAGCDEAGRGCLAGPVFAAAVILPQHFSHPLLNDSKKLTAKVRSLMRQVIEREALAWSVAWLDNNRIDELNILRASILAMHEALDKLKVRPEHIIVDGNRFYPYKGIPHTCLVKGDAQYASIAAASVLAKTWRDEYMLNLHKTLDCYGWDRNKGYPTLEHRTAIARFGISSFHRKTFSLTNHQLAYNF